LFLRRVRPLSRLQQAKNSHEGGRQSFSRTALQSQLAKFWVGAKFCPKTGTSKKQLGEHLMFLSSEVLRRSTKSSETQSEGRERAKTKNTKQIIKSPWAY